MKVFYQSFGCKVNQYETQFVSSLFKAEGFECCDTLQSADIAVVNTCTVTSSADNKCRQFIRKIKKQSPHCIICVMGCMTQVSSGDDTLDMCEVIAGSRNKTLLPVLLKQYLATGRCVRAIEPIDNERHFEAMQSSGSESKTRAYIKIQDGCEMFCTYCIIPYARGKLSSKPLYIIKEEAAALVSSGHKELILTGINLCCYGRDFKNGTRLIDAIEAVCRIEGDFRVRLSSVEPEMIIDEDIARMKALDKLCPHFHLSLQSGCDKTLKAMKRHYTTAKYKMLCDKLKNAFDDCAITTDIMTGFPQETQEDHSASLSFVKSCTFADAHIFPYSRRSGTPADKMEGQTDNAIKHQRALEMAGVIAESRREFIQSMVGRTVRVLFEKESTPEYHQGHSDNYILVKVPRMAEGVTLRRRFGYVLITKAGDSESYGEIISVQ